MLRYIIINEWEIDLYYTQTKWQQIDVMNEERTVIIYIVERLNFQSFHVRFVHKLNY